MLDVRWAQHLKSQQLPKRQQGKDGVSKREQYMTALNNYSICEERIT